MATLGMDTGAGLFASAELERGSQEIAGIATRLESALNAFDWAGPDADRVRGAWSATERPRLEQVGREISSMALTIRQEADAQDAASSEAGSPADDRTDGLVSPQVAERWAWMTPEERQAALVEQTRLIAEQQGIDPPPRVVFEDMEDTDGDGVDDDPSTDSGGSYSHDERVLRIDTNDIADPDSLNSVAHEMRHAAQNQMTDQYRDLGVVGRGLVRLGISDDPFVARGSNITEVGSWADNFDDYTSPEVDFPRYEGQPVEVDARRSGGEYADGLTVDDLDRLRPRVSAP